MDDISSDTTISIFQVYFGLNVPTALLAVIALGGSIMLRVRVGPQYKTVSWLSFFSAMCLVLCQLFSFIVNIGQEPSIILYVLNTFFQGIFPALLWWLLFSIIHIATHSRLQFHGPVKQANAVAKTVRSIYSLTGLIILFNIVLAALTGVFGDSASIRDVPIVIFHSFTAFFPMLSHCIPFFTMMHGGNHYQDIRSFKGSFTTVLILSVITILGPVVLFALKYAILMYINGYIITYIISTIMIRICGAASLCIIVFMFPRIWLRDLREYEIRNEMGDSNLVSGDDDQDQTWNPNDLYDSQPQQGYVNLDGLQTINYNKSNIH